MVPGRYGIARLGPDAPVPGWAGGSGFWAVVRADDEITVVCLEDRIPDTVETQRGWRCLRTVGPFAFDDSGIVRSLIAPLSDAEICIFVVCTYDGEHLLVAESDLDRSKSILAAEGHSFVGAGRDVV